MAVFIALFFQVLFVFFAMAINVGLVVHDKINLQNSVDLAAYYGAAKQAEVLNQIAHINYQMRQNYKLFVWRYRVLGTLIQNSHPFRGSVPLPEGPYTGLSPSVCVAGKYWKEYQDVDPSAQGFCRESIVNIPSIPPVSGGGGIVPGFGGLINLVEGVRLSNWQLCKEAGALNWSLAARILAHFRVDGLVRKKKIEILTESLSSPSFTDLRNESVEEGVRNTFEYNLTASNFRGIKDFEYFNSMTQGQCADPRFWLPEIKINPVILYLKLVRPTASDDCRGRLRYNRGGGASLEFIFPEDFFTNPIIFGSYGDPVLIEHWKGEPTQPFPSLHSSVGFEKNPWCVTYSGVSASTEVRKPFSPGSGTVELKAHGFAKPFGGRIGPWYGKIWPQGASNSQAGNRGDLVDGLLPSRTVNGATTGSSNTEKDIANYSRFPGDSLGFNSGLALSAMLPKFNSQVIPPYLSPGNQAPLALASYNHLGWVEKLESTGDSLARNSLLPAVQRPFELAAVAPDAFDALYYSIEPTYFDNYFTSAATNGGAHFQNNEKIYDFGSTKDGGHPSTSPGQPTVLDQVSNATDLYHPSAKYIVREWNHLLTSWHQKEAVNYNMDSNQFGKCQVPVPPAKRNQFPTTGNCISGGRTGYSVKNVSMDFLLSNEHELSGGGGKGALLNPPPF